MNRIAIWIAAPLLAGCALSADDRPVVTYPANDQTIGGKKDTVCRSADQPCFRIEAEGRVPKGLHAVFAVEPMASSPRMWLQPRIHSVSPDGTVTGLVYLGEEDHAAKEFFKIYLLACRDASALDSGKTILRVPKGCAISPAVKVYRAR